MDEAVKPSDKETRLPLRLVLEACAALGIISTFATLLSLLALHDVSHAHGDVSLEWSVIRGAHIVTFVFYAAFFYLITRIWPGERTRN